VIVSSGYWPIAAARWSGAIEEMHRDEIYRPGLDPIGAGQVWQDQDIREKDYSLKDE